MASALGVIKRWTKKLKWRTASAAYWKSIHTWSQASLNLWRRRRKYREGRLHRHVSMNHRKAVIDKWRHLVYEAEQFNIKRRDRRDEASKMLRRRREQASDARRVLQRWRARGKGRYIAGTRFTWSQVLAKSWYPRIPSKFKTDIIRHARNLQELLRRVNEERAKRDLGPASIIEILSWLRSYAKNKFVGGAKYSQHKKGCATDISIGEIDRLCPWSGGRAWWTEQCEDIFDGIGKSYGTAIHVDSRGWDTEWSYP